jgi:hypothetical protein
MRKKYIPFFTSTKLTETFNSQKEIYDIVEDLSKVIRNIFVIDLTSYIDMDQTKQQIITQTGHELYIYPSFEILCYLNIKYLLSRLSHRNGAYVDLVSFYDKLSYSDMIIEVRHKNSPYKGSYDVGTKDVKLRFDKNIDKFEKYMKEGNVKLAVNFLFHDNNFENSLVHEFTHLYDDVISKEKAVTQKMSSYSKGESNVSGYLNNLIEINARFYEASLKNSYLKLVSCTSHDELKRQWERHFWPAMREDINYLMLKKENRNKVFKRSWVEFTTLSDKEEKILSILSKKTMLNNGNLKKIDVRIKNRSSVVKELKQDFIDLSKGQISKSIFNKNDPFDNEEINDEIKTKQEMLRKLEMRSVWENLYYFHDIYKLISKYNLDNYSTEKLNKLIIELKLDSGVINKIKSVYSF